jgi:hypothetical protein
MLMDKVLSKDIRLGHKGEWVIYFHYAMKDQLVE